MRKQIEKNIILFYCSRISLFLLLMIFHVTIYAQNASATSILNTPAENAVEKESIQSANEVKVDDPVTSEIENTNNTPVQNESILVLPSIKGNEMPDETTLTDLQMALSEPYMPIDIMIENQYLSANTDAFLFRGIVYVSLRSMVNLVQGSTLFWNQENLQADVTFPINGIIKNLSFFANSTVYLDNGVITPLPAATLQKDGVMIIPLSFMTELLGISINYDTMYHIINLDTQTLAINPAALETRFYGVTEIKDLSRLIYKEAGNTSYAAMHGVASVILNHVRHPLYPNTVSGVIFAVAPSGAPHYTPAHKPGFNSVIPNYNSILAAKKVLRGENSIGQAIFFNTRPFKNRKISTKINGIYFCY